MAAQRGFSMLELMIVVAVMVPLLGALGGLSSVVTKTVDANDNSAEVIDHLRRTVQRIGQFARPARLASVRVRANQADVAAGRAANPGEWISPVELEERPAVRFLAAEGLLSMNARLSTPARELEFQLDPTETDNGLDDDGDGLVDEGELFFRSDSVQVSLGRFEDCQFTLDGRYLRVRLRGARRGGDGRIYRNAVSQSFFVRNN